MLLSSLPFEVSDLQYGLYNPNFYPSIPSFSSIFSEFILLRYHHVSLSKLDASIKHFEYWGNRFSRWFCNEVPIRRSFCITYFNL
jgi:hypothetical protein